MLPYFKSDRENQNITLSEEDLEMLLKENSKSGSFVQDTFRGKFFQTGVHALIDNIRSNIDNLSGYKKDIALFTLAKTCTAASGSFGHFQSSNSGGFKDHCTDTAKQFIERFKKVVLRINELVFDNGQDNKAFNMDVLDVLEKAKVDLAYFDPPYKDVYRCAG